VSFQLLPALHVHRDRVDVRRGRAIRLCLGIGEEGLPDDVSEFVLADFPQAREVELREMILRAGDALKTILAQGAAKAMSVFNA
jgi:peptidyl-tRNA hydrolase